MSTRTYSTGSPAAPPKRRDAAPTVTRDGDAIVIDIPMNLRRRSGRKEVVLPPGVAPTAPAAPPTPLALAVARAFRWQEMIESGQAKSNSDLARKLKLDQSYIARTIRLASLAPDIVEAILDGQEPDGLSLKDMRADIPLLWDEQRDQVGGNGDAADSGTSAQSAPSSSTATSATTSPRSPHPQPMPTA
jgi:hypothetical protein